MAMANKEKPGTSVQDVLQAHYQKYGRNFFSRYDYEEVESEPANKMMKQLEELFASEGFVGSELKATSSDKSFKVKEAANFSYTDPVDHSVSKNQGLYTKFDDGSRIVVRLSGTGSSGATIRLYVERYESDSSKFGLNAQEYLKDNISLALNLLKFKEYVGRDEPDVKT